MLRLPQACYCVATFLLVVQLAAADSPASPSAAATQAQLPNQNKPLFRLVSDPAIKLRCGGVIGQRIAANKDNWLITCPRANPGLLEMFRLRDRQPGPQLVPWAGEFVGKYLISAIEALRMTDDEQLDETVAEVVRQVIWSQAEDGYLGPFPRNERLLGHWDLWGHYHVMLALLLWHESGRDRLFLEIQQQAGNQPVDEDFDTAIGACRRAADLICKTYLEAGRSVLDAGSPEMNMAVIHALGRLYRATSNERYLRQMRQIEADWQRAGDYFRTGLAGVPFFRTPRPRWESLHDLQGLVELYCITGDQRYKQAFLNHWRSIRDWDRRNTGGFSSGEQATGNPYEPTAIETCCTIAWMAITLDALALTGDSTIADELELATYNAMLGAQHPSGRWWTYSTPMDGLREASAHAIVFQARAGTPELNCCSVNGPRGLGMLSEWAVMQAADGLAINYYGPAVVETQTKDGDKVVIEMDDETRYPWDGHVDIKLGLAARRHFKLMLRIPQWSRKSRVVVREEEVAARPGSYLEIDRDWEDGDTIRLDFDMSPRYESGDLQAAKQVSIYRGPILLAYDQRNNRFDEAGIPVLEHLPRILASELEVTTCCVGTPPATRIEPWLTIKVPVADGAELVLCDFASAGAAGTRYRSWIPASAIAPPAPVADLPADAAALPPGRLLFTWRRGSAELDVTRTLQIANSPDFQSPLLEVDADQQDRLILAEDKTRSLKPGHDYYWRIAATNAYGRTFSRGPARRFRIDPALAPFPDSYFTAYGERNDGVIVAAALEADAKADHGELSLARDVQPAEGGGLRFNGRSSLVTYKLKRFPEQAYAVSLWCRIVPGDISPKLAQLFSAWRAGGDDPLRICLDQGELHARIENHRGNATTEGVPIATGRWIHVAAVKVGERLILYVDGHPRAEAKAPAEVISAATDFGLGGNPHFTGDEYLSADLRDARLYGRALSAEEVRALSKAKQ